MSPQCKFSSLSRKFTIACSLTVRFHSCRSQPCCNARTANEAAHNSLAARSKGAAQDKAGQRAEESSPRGAGCQARVTGSSSVVARVARLAACFAERANEPDDLQTDSAQHQWRAVGRTWAPYPVLALGFLLANEEHDVGEGVLIADGQLPTSRLCFRICTDGKRMS